MTRASRSRVLRLAPLLCFGCLTTWLCGQMPAFINPNVDLPKDQLVNKPVQGPTVASPALPRDVTNAALGDMMETPKLEASDKDFSLLLASQFPVFVAVGALIPVLPLFGQEFGLSQSSVGLLVSSPSLAKLILNLPFGQLADSLGRRDAWREGVQVFVGQVASGICSRVQ